MLTPSELVVTKIEMGKWRVAEGLYRGMKIDAPGGEEIEIGECARVVCDRGRDGLWALVRVEKIGATKEIEKRCCRQN